MPLARRTLPGASGSGAPRARGLFPRGWRSVQLRASVRVRPRQVVLLYLCAGERPAVDRQQEVAPLPVVRERQLLISPPSGEIAGGRLRRDLDAVDVPGRRT